MTAKAQTAGPASRIPFNTSVAQTLREIAMALEQQGANPFRVNAYRRGAATVEALDVDLHAIFHEGGSEGLERLPGIGRGLAAVIGEIVRTGRTTRLDRLNGAAEPEHVLQSVPGIGPALARAIHERLHVDSLEALEVAAHDGRLAKLRGIGKRRLAAIQANLAAVLGRRRGVDASAPQVALILDVDREYRLGAAQGSLQRIAPRRFNPQGERWLPILHTQRGDWHFTALFSNTARAHQLGRTDDWVVIYFYDEDHRESQHTVVTETRGDLAGRRVVRGREQECRVHYAGGER